MIGENNQAYCICTYGASIRTRDLRTNVAVEAYMPFWAKEGKAEVWEVKGKVGSSRANEKE